MTDHPTRRALLACLLWTMAGTPLAAMPPKPSPDQAQEKKAMREITDQGYRVQLDLSTQVLRLSVPEDRDFGNREGKQDALLSATLSALTRDHFLSASVLAQKAKQFDDGLYAAVDLAAQQGAGRFPGKASLLRSLIRTLTQQVDAPVTSTPATVMAAGKLGKLDIALPAAAQQPVQQLVDDFLQNEVRSKPIAFYTWSGDLSAIFQQDRMLQTELKDKTGTEAVVRGLHADKEARGIYEGYLALVSRLTNPLAYADLRKQLADLDRGGMDVPGKEIYFFPPSRSHETELVKKLYGNRPIPEGFSLIDEMVQRIQAGQLPLRPTAESGWYDYQTWSLEPLVIPERMPEAKHLNLAQSYRKQLLELFKGILALTRETHIKQLEIPMVGAAAPPPWVVIHIQPELSAEPLATYYFRRAWSYYYVRWALEQTFGAVALETMHRMTAAGPVQSSLREEIRSMETLFYGAHVTVCRQLGMPPTISPHIGSGKGDQTDAAPLADWLGTLPTDPDVGQDARMMVPVFYDVERKKTKVWVVLGWADRPMEVAFDRTPTAVVLNQAGKRVTDNGPRLSFHSTSYSIAYPVTAEVYVTKILNRDEFRQHCDRYKTRSAILANLP